MCEYGGECVSMEGRVCVWRRECVSVEGRVCVSVEGRVCVWRRECVCGGKSVSMEGRVCEGGMCGCVVVHINFGWVKTSQRMKLSYATTRS